MRTLPGVPRFALTVIVLLLFVFGVKIARADGLISGRVVVRNSTGKLSIDASNFVVFIDNLKIDNPRQLPTQIPTLASVNKRFVPEVLPIVVGTTVEFPNGDMIFHNVFSLSKTKPFDLGLYGYGASRRVKFDKPGLVKIYCNIHEKMVGYILVLENPFFTVTNSEGVFNLDQVPDGSHDLVAWNPFSDSQKKKVKNEQTTSAGLAAEAKGKRNLVQFDFQETRVSEKHRNKWGLHYKENY